MRLNRRPPVALLCVPMIGAFGCSSATAPSPSPSPAVGSSLAISGATVLTPGLTSPLTAMNSAGAALSTGVTWHSQATAVATVSQTGLVTAIGAGTTTVTASAGDSSGSVSIVVEQTGTMTSTISACQTVSVPGVYVLGADLAPAAPFGPCLNVAGVASVQIDCHGHVVPGFHLSNANSVTIANCIVTSSQTSAGFYLPLNLNNVQNTTISNCIVSAVAGTAINLLGGGNNQLIQNTVTGGYDGGLTANGSDDGIGLINETGDTIRGNVVSGFYDAAVEGEDVVANTIIRQQHLLQHRDRCYRCLLVPGLDK